jgi:hypothetical protein
VSLYDRCQSASGTYLSDSTVNVTVGRVGHNGTRLAAQGLRGGIDALSRDRSVTELHSKYRYMLAYLSHGLVVCRRCGLGGCSDSAEEVVHGELFGGNERTHDIARGGGGRGGAGRGCSEWFGLCGGERSSVVLASLVGRVFCALRVAHLALQRR